MWGKAFFLVVFNGERERGYGLGRRGVNKMSKIRPKMNFKCPTSDLSRARHPRAEISSFKTNGSDQKLAGRTVPDSSSQTV